MNKVVAGFVVAFVAALMSLGFATSAQADYGDNGTPPTSVSPPTVTSVSPPASTSVSTPSAGSLPNTGGPNSVVFAGALAMIVVGGFSIAVSRRRPTN